jgi:hypothetical protein
MIDVNKLIVLFFLCINAFAYEFNSVNYFTKNYLFDAQIYSVNTFISENTLSYQLNDFSPHVNFIQYQGLDEYKESDFGLGSEYKLTDKLNLDIGSWYYFYYSAGDHYFEPYASLTYDWIVSPKLYVSMITYNNTPRATISFDYSKNLTDKLNLNIRPVIGTADYNIRYGYYGIVFASDYSLNNNFALFTTAEIDKPFSSPDNSIVYTYSLGVKISL